MSETTGVFAGGLDIKAQEAALRLGPDIVIATPGRLIDHLHNAPNFSLHSIEVLVLDEADRMLDEAFADQMKELIRLCSANRQTLLFSATMTVQIEQLADMSLKNPVRLFINENTETALNLRQEFIRIRENREHERESIVVALITRIFPDHTMLFVHTKKACQRLHIVLGLLGIKVGQLHSGLSQTQRIETLSRFKNGELDVLVSTDLAARGLDIEGVLTVINMEMPVSLKQYIHRVGRTARAGRVGRSVSLFGTGDRKLLKEIVASHKGSPLKQRHIDAGVIEAYSKRIAALEESVQRVEEELRAERAMRLAQEELERGENKLQGKAHKRHWILPSDSTSKKGGYLRRSLLSRSLLRSNSNNYEREYENREHVSTFHVEVQFGLVHAHCYFNEIKVDEICQRRSDDYEVRNAKRSHKQRRMRVMADGDRKSAHQKGKKRKSAVSFTSHFTSITPKSIKRFRYGLVN
ncbi:unnamed protein product [Toxocara canis]|uniref:ATP-dependent RNA helicase DDX27 n=1 Tax=Toxocara canis TaxID=6265 RepID=A0A183UCY9_TOXCA|nr:unnamed protein product [Toxocara canis]